MTRAHDGHPPGAHTELAGVLGNIARTLQDKADVATTLEGIVQAAIRNIPGTEEAGISLIEKGAVRTMAPSSETVGRIDRLQYELGEGPCVDAIVDHEIYRTGDLRREDGRWPAFGPRAYQLGMTSMLSYRLFTMKDTLGALNLYSREPDAFGPEAERVGEPFAAHAAIALVGSQKEAQLYTALASRDTIATAKGILMERHDIDPERAFQLLVNASQETNTKLYDVASLVVDRRRDLY